MDNYYRVSGRGNGVGITVLRVPIASQPSRYTTFIFHILPKLWRVGTEPGLFSLNESMLDSGKELHFELYEQDILFTAVPDVKKLMDTLVVQAEVSEESSEKENETTEEAQDRLSPLWSVAIPPHHKVSRLLTVSKGKDLNGPLALWKMLDSYQAKIEPNPTSKDFGPSGALMFASNPLMRMFVYQRFVEDTIEALRSRRPQYVMHTDELSVVKGRMAPQGLVRRQIRRSHRIECEFDELTTDNFLWQVIRAAVEVCIPALQKHRTEGYKGSYDKALLAAAQLRDVTVSSRHALISALGSYSVPRREHPAVKKSYHMAAAILRQVFNASVDDNEGAGVIANLKYTMNGVWEQMVEQHLNGVEGAEAKSQREVPTLHVFFKRNQGEWGKPADGGKRPDVQVSFDGKAFYLDAKYKSNSLKLTDAGMSDQYQMATYALRTRRNVYLAYPRCLKEGKKIDPLFQYIPLEDHFESGNKTPQTDRFVKTGQFYLPFPSPEQAKRGEFVPTASWVDSQLVRELVETSDND